jgi:7-cyano-7-deazaguanine synthase in queuosine biosynthesis
MQIVISPYIRDVTNGLMSMKILVPDVGIEQEIRISPLQAFQIIPRPTKKSLDFLYFSVYVSVIDRLIKRSWFADNWTRNIEVSIPVSDTMSWLEAKGELEKALNFLSGDHWSLSFYDIQDGYFLTDELPLEENDKTYTNICLFSGGLDSFIGAIDLAEEDDNIILSSFYDAHGALFGKQNDIYQKIKGNKNIFLSQFALNRIKSNEDTTRARSVLFLGISMFLAINLGISKIITPENGLISVNLPLTTSRSGSNSTRTMHPYFISSFQKAISILGHNIEIDNPYIYMTKGEMLLNCKNKVLLNDLLKQTMSCSHPSMRQYWHRKDVKHCGYCMPCIIRRASINKYNSSKDNGHDYGIDIFNEDELRLDQNGVIPRNVKAIIDFLALKLDKKEYRKLLNQSVKVENADLLVDMVDRGYNEIRQLINDKGNETMKGAIS